MDSTSPIKRTRLSLSQKPSKSESSTPPSNKLRLRERSSLHAIHSPQKGVIHKIKMKHRTSLPTFKKTPGTHSKGGRPSRKLKVGPSGDTCRPSVGKESSSHAHDTPATGEEIELTAVCPVQGCLSEGHLNGIDSWHMTISGCPLYHGLNWHQCKEMRAREEGLALDALVKEGQGSLEMSCTQKPQNMVLVKEPSLEGLASTVEIYQFRRAQQTLVSDKEREVRRHFELSSSNEKVYRIAQVVVGRYEMSTWYRSSYPNHLACMPTIYICEFCLTAMKHSAAYERHKIACNWKFPPGDEIYRHKNYSFFEVDGDKFRDYCQNLCLLAKLFLKHKTVHESTQVSPFFFYILTKADSEGCHFIGYFSKQKWADQKLTGTNPSMYYNVSCILTMPQYMRQGFGKMLIDFSYALSRLEDRIGSPERPLSDLGLITYRNYWREVIIRYLNGYKGKDISLRAVVQETNLHISDIVSTLLSMGMIKYSRTQYFVVRKQSTIDKYMAQYSSKPSDPDKAIHPECLHWTANTSTDN